MGYPGYKPPRPAPNEKRQAEKLQGLVDDRGSTSDANREDQRAVTRGDLAGQGTVELQAVLLTTGAPTAADYNKLVHDQRALAALLNKLGGDYRWTA